MRGAIDLQLNIGELGQNGDQHALDRKGSGLEATDYGGGLESPVSCIKFVVFRS